MRKLDVLRNVFPRRLRQIIKELMGVTALQERTAHLERHVTHLGEDVARLEQRIAPPKNPLARLKSSRTDPDNFSNPDVLLIQAPGWGILTPPLALAMLTAYIRSNGYKVLPLDLNIECYLAREGKYENLWKLEQSLWYWGTPSKVDEYIEDNKDLMDTFVDVVIASGVKLVGFTIYGSSYRISSYLAKRIKAANPEIKVVFGGPHVSRFMSGKDAVQKDYVDFAVQGEGELVLLDIVKRTAAGEEIDSCPGTLTLKDGEVVDCGDRDLITDLNELPFADFSDYDFKNYQEQTRLPIMSSRGCVNRCIFCNERPYWRKFRFPKAERIFAEIKSQLEKYPFIDYVDFQDSVVNGNIEQLGRFADLIIESDIKFQWAAQAIIRKELTYDYLKKLARSGCMCLGFGFETPSQSLLMKIGKVMTKGVDLDRVVRDCNRAGLSCTYNFMFGLPGETEENAQETLDFLVRNKENIGAVNPSSSFCAFYPGALAYEDPEKHGIHMNKVDCDGMHVLFWKSADGKNNYLTRLEKFEKFCQLALDLGLRTSYPSRRLLDRERNIGRYYHYEEDFDKAVPHFKAWLEENPGDIDILRKLADCHDRLGSPDEAAAARTKIEALAESARKPGGQ